MEPRQRGRGKSRLLGAHRCCSVGFNGAPTAWSGKVSARPIWARRGAASMEPRQRGRGKGWGFESSIPVTILLQWSPDSVVGERGLCRGRSAEEAMMASMEPRQRGRGKDKLLSVRNATVELQWSPDSVVGESDPVRAGAQGRRRASMEPRQRGRGKESLRRHVRRHATLLQWSPDSVVGESCSRAPVPRRASTCFNGAPTAWSGKEDRPRIAARDPTYASMEPRQRGRGKSSNTEHRSTTTWLQWSPDSVVGESSSSSRGIDDTQRGFNGAPTAWSGKEAPRTR